MGNTFLWISQWIGQPFLLLVAVALIPVQVRSFKRAQSEGGELLYRERRP